MDDTTGRGRVRRCLAVVAIAAMVVVTVPALAAPAGGSEVTETRRIAGPDRYATAAAVAEDTFPGGADSVVLATGEGFADALAANGLAGALDAPILLTGRDRLPTATARALTELEPKTVHVVGGPAAISDAVVRQLARNHTVQRIQGADRFGTAAAVAAAIAGTADGVGHTDRGTTAVLASGTTFPDAVSGGAVAYAGRFPLLLTQHATVPAATTEALAELDVDHVVVLGGTAAVGADVLAALQSAGYSTERLAGPDRWATNVAVNRWAADHLGFAGPAAYLATGSAFADALAGGPAAGSVAAPLLLTAPTVLPPAVQAHLVADAEAIDAITAIGGPAAVSDAVLAAAADAAQLVDRTPSATRGLLNGTVVSRNVAPEGISAGDQWTLHFSGPVQVRPDASITVRAGDGPPIMFTRTMATWEVEGASLVITLGSSADGVRSSAYTGVVITQLAGIVDAGGRAIGIEQLQDRGLDHNGPELMRDSSTCDRGDRTCTIAFNERVTSASATSPLRYTFSGTLGGRSLDAVVLGPDGRTITLRFGGPLRPGDTIRPAGILGAVTDLHGQASTQPAMHFVR